MPGASAPPASGVPGGASSVGPVPGGLPGGDALNSGATASAAPAPEVVGAPTAPSTSKALEDASEAASAAGAQLKELLAVAQPFVQAHIISALRPWRAFCVVRRPEPGSSLHARVEQNLAHFQANYMVIGLTSLIIFLISHPAHCIVGILTAAAWAVYVQKGGLEPSWKPKVGGVELASSHRLMILSACSIGLLFIVAGQLMLELLGLTAVFTLGHAALHPGGAAVGDFSVLSGEDVL